jgi:hypothetical protein
MLGYGFLFMGFSVPYLIEHFFGPTSALIVAVICTVVGVCFLGAGHLHRLPDQAPLSAKRKALTALLMLAIICTVCEASWHIYAVHRPEVAPPLQPPPVAPTTINQTSTGSDCSNIVAGSASQINCNAGKERHEKDKTGH